METADNSKKTTRVVGRPFVPGQSGNPGGRPKSAQNFGEQVRAFLEQAHPDAKQLTAKLKSDVELRTRLDVLLLKMEQDDPKTLLAYGFGKPIETHEVSGPDGEPIVILKHAHEISEAQ